MIGWETLSRELIARFPDIADKIRTEEDNGGPEGLGVDSLFAEIFAPYVLELLRDPVGKESELAMAFSTIEEMANSDDHLVVAMMVLSVLGIIELDEAMAVAARTRMTPRTRAMFPTRDWLIQNPGKRDGSFRPRKYFRGS